jgi:hypothetical protein
VAPRKAIRRGTGGILTVVITRRLLQVIYRCFFLVSKVEGTAKDLVLAAAAPCIL